MYNFLGLKWNLRENDLVPNSYFAMGKRRGGPKTGGINEIDGDEVISLVGESISCRLLSRLYGQAYDRLGLFMASLSMGLKILTSHACELSDVSELDLSLAERDPDYVAIVNKSW